MTPLADVHGSQSLLARLADPAARALVLAALVGMALAVLRVKSTAARLFAWTAVLYAALAMPILGSLLPAVPVNLPNLHLPFASPKASAPASSTDAVNSAAVSAPATAVSAPATAVSLPEPSARISRTSSAPDAVVQRSRASSASTYFPRNEAATRSSSDGLAAPSRAAFTATSPEVPEHTAHSFSWLALAIGAYLFVAACLLARFALGLVLARRLIRASEEISDSRALDRLERCSRVAGLEALPRLAESEAVSVPVTLGVREPSILVPADWREWDDAKLVAVLAHELSHVARRDALTQRLSQIHRAIFWFSPLAWWLDRRLADLAEEASDEAALSGGVDRADYARTLLGFFEALQATRGRVWWQGVAMAKAGQAERRVDRILAWKGAVSMSLRKSIVVLLAILAVPVLYLTAGLRPNLQAQDQQAQAVTPPAQPAAPTAAPAPAPRATPYVTGVPSQAPAPAAAPGSAALPATPNSVAPIAPMVQVGTIAPATPVGTVAPMAPLGPTKTPRAQIAAPYEYITPPPTPGAAPRAGVWGGVPNGVVAPAQLATPRPGAYVAANGSWAQSGSSASGSSSGGSFAKDNVYSYGEDDDGQRYVIVSGNSDSVTMSGDSEDARHARALRKKIPGDFIWFERDEKSYVIRDQATVDRARKLFAPQEELGRQQEELGKQQEALGDQQEALGKKMEEVRVKVPDMTADIEKLKAELKALQDGGTQEQLGNLQSEIGELQSKLGELQSRAGDQQGKLGEEMGKLGEQQGKLGEQQGKLGRKQGELAREAAIEMRHMLDEAVTKGTAQPEP
jgi:bla regulator protein blaR1